MVQILNNMSTAITLQPKYTATSFQTELDFQGQTMVSVDPIEKYSAFYLTVACFEANRHIIRVQNLQKSVVTFRPGQTVGYLECRSKGCSLP